VSAHTNRSRNSTSQNRAANKDAIGPISFALMELDKQQQSPQSIYFCDGKKMKVNASPRTKKEFMK